MTENAGSLQPLDRSNSVHSWSVGIDASGLVKLKEISESILTQVEETVGQVVRGRIKVGRLLLEAREFFPGDKEFGQWRKNHTIIESRQSAWFMMELARQAGNGRISSDLIRECSPSVLQELLTASDSVVKTIENKVSNQEKLPTVKEVRDAKSEATGAAPDPDPVSTQPPPDSMPTDTPSDGSRDPSPDPAPPPESYSGSEPVRGKVQVTAYKFEGDFLGHTKRDDAYDLAGRVIHLDREFAEELAAAITQRLEDAE